MSLFSGEDLVSLSLLSCSLHTVGCLLPSSPSWGFTFFDHHPEEGREGDVFPEVSADISLMLFLGFDGISVNCCTPNSGHGVSSSRPSQNRGEASRKHQGPVGGRD